MLTRTIIAATVLALAQFTLATPPGCLLGAVNSYSDPADVASVCKQKDLTSKVATFCGDASQSAMVALADICNAQGVKVATAIPSSSATASGSSHKPSGTGSFATYATASASGSSSGYSSGSGSGSGSGNSTAPTATGGPRASGTSTGGIAQSTGAAGKLELGIAAIVAGLMAVAL